LLNETAATFVWALTRDLPIKSQSLRQLLKPRMCMLYPSKYMVCPYLKWNYYQLLKKRHVEQPVLTVLS